MAKRKKQSISMILVEILGGLIIFKTFVWILETRVMHVPIDIPELNYAIGIAFLVLLLRVAFVIWMGQRKKKSTGTLTQSSDTFQYADPNDLNMCVACNKTVSDKVKQYCLSRPDRFQGKIYCYEHQASHQ